MKLKFSSLAMLIMAIAVPFVLSACTPQQIKADFEAKAVHDIAVAVTPVTAPDLEAAAAFSDQHGDVDGATCAREVDAYLVTLSTTPAGGLGDQLSGIKGIATAIAVQRVAALSPPNPPQPGPARSRSSPLGS